MPATVNVPLAAKPAVDFTVSEPPARLWPPPSTFVLADCSGVFAFVELLALPSEPFGLDFPLVGAALSVSALIARLAALTGVAALLSMNASDCVTKTATAMPAPRPEAEESAFVETFVLTFEPIVTFWPAAEIALVPESWLLAIASTNVAATEAS